MKRLVSILFVILMFSLSLVGQEKKEVQHSISFDTQFFQIKDQFNYGLAHSGANLMLEYTRRTISDKHVVSYESELGFGANYNQGLGLNWIFKPLDIYYGFRINKGSDLEVTLGPYMSAYYMWQLYPELQSGHMFWLSSYEIGPRILLSASFKDRIIDFSFSNSVVSLNSRPEFETEQYFYSLSMADFAGNPHTNMGIGSLDVFSHINIGLEISKPGKKFSLGYEFEYYGYLHEPKIEALSHSVKMIWKTGTGKNK